MANTDITGFWKIAEADPEHLALVDADHNQMTYGELYELTNKIVHGLRAAGLQRGDQVTTVLPNSFEQVAVCLAAFQGGFFVTTINWHLVGPEISYIVNDAETKALIVSDRFEAEAVRVLGDCVVPEANRFSVGPVAGFRPFSDLISGQSGERPDELYPGSYMFYTSGTTGRPKGVRRALADGDVDEISAGSGGLFMLFGTMPHDDNVQITQAPTYHTAVNNWTTMSLHMGHTVILMDRWTPEGLLERIERYRVTHSHMVPTMFNRLLQLPDDVRARVRCLVVAPHGSCRGTMPDRDQTQDDPMVGRLDLGVLRGDRRGRHDRRSPRMAGQTRHSRKAMAGCGSDSR